MVLLLLPADVSTEVKGSLELPVQIIETHDKNLENLKTFADVGLLSLHIEEEDSQAHIENEFLTRKIAPSSVTFDLSKGGNLVSCVGNHDFGRETWHHERTEVDGVWVPEKMTNSENTPDHTETRTVILKKHFVNQPLDKKPLTIDNFRIRTGAMLDQPAEKGKG